MKFLSLTLLAAATFLTAPAVISGSPFHADSAYARRGADDAAGHKRQGRGADDAKGHATITMQDEVIQEARRGRGADDAPGHKRQGRGADDGVGHASITIKNELIQEARRSRRGRNDGTFHA